VFPWINQYWTGLKCVSYSITQVKNPIARNSIAILCSYAPQFANENAPWLDKMTALRVFSQSPNHRYPKNIDCLSFVMCLLLAPHLPRAFFAFLLRPLTVLMKQKGSQYMPLISLSFLDVCGPNTSNYASSFCWSGQIFSRKTFFYCLLNSKLFFVFISQFLAWQHKLEFRGGFVKHINPT